MHPEYNVLVFLIYRNSNCSVSESVLQTLKKQCSPTMKKTFKERNPDIDMDEIQNNPNVPEDVKAAISGALLLSAEDDDEEAGESENDNDNDNEQPELPVVEELETFDEDFIMDYADYDDKRAYKGRRKDVEDEDWLCKLYTQHFMYLLCAPRQMAISNWFFFYKFIAAARRTKKPKRGKSKKKKSKHKSKSSTAEKPDQSRDKAKKKKNIKDKQEESSVVVGDDHTKETKCRDDQPMDCTETVKEELADELAAKDTKQIKIPKKRDGIQKKDAAIVKRSPGVRRQFTTVSAIMECIESVVRGTDVSVATIKSEDIKSERDDDIMSERCYDESFASDTSALISSPVASPPSITMLLQQHESETLRSGASSSKSKSKKSSTQTSNTEYVLQMGKANLDILNQSSALHELSMSTTTKKASVIRNKSPKTTTQTTTQTTSMQKK